MNISDMKTFELPLADESCNPEDIDDKEMTNV